MNTNFISEANLQHAEDLVISYAPKVLLAIIVLILGFWVIGKLTKLIEKSLSKTHVDISLGRFLSSLISVFLKLMLLLSVASMIGINTTSFVAIFGALMVGIGMALNGTIGHFASGILLMVFKPFKVGDLVTIGDGRTGVVEAINAFNTTLVTLDNQRIIVGNSNITNSTITNISGEENVGVDLTFGISYDADIDKARAVILEVGKNCKWILDTPAQGVVVSGLGDSAVNLATRPFCKSADAPNVKFYMLEHVKKAFDQNGISMPYPQIDAHIIQENK